MASNKKIFKKIEDLRNQGMSAVDACHKLGIKPHTYYNARWAQNKRDYKAAMRRTETAPVTTVIAKNNRVFVAYGEANDVIRALETFRANND